MLYCTIRKSIKILKREAKWNNFTCCREPFCFIKTGCITKTKHSTLMFRITRQLWNFVAIWPFLERLALTTKGIVINILSLYTAPLSVYK